MLVNWVLQLTVFIGTLLIASATQKLLLTTDSTKLNLNFGSQFSKSIVQWPFNRFQQLTSPHNRLVRDLTKTNQASLANFRFRQIRQAIAPKILPGPYLPAAAYFVASSVVRVMFGSASLFVLHHPVEFERKKKDGVKIKEVTYDLAQEEIAENSGFNMNKNSGQSKSK